jgi:hypothetical protein
LRRPGDKLDERQLAKQFGMSRTGLVVSPAAHLLCIVEKILSRDDVGTLI